MKFELPFENGPVKAGYTGKTARLYREQFGKDIMIDLSDAASKAMGMYLTGQKMGTLDFDNAAQMTEATVKAIGGKTLEQFVWAAIASCNDDTAPYDRWIDEIEDYPTLLTVGYICYGYMIGVVPTVEPETDEEPDETKTKKKSRSRKSASSRKTQDSVSEK